MTKAIKHSPGCFGCDPGCEETLTFDAAADFEEATASSLTVDPHLTANSPIPFGFDPNWVSWEGQAKPVSKIGTDAYLLVVNTTGQLELSVEGNTIVVDADADPCTLTINGGTPLSFDKPTGTAYVNLEIVVTPNWIYVGAWSPYRPTVDRYVLGGWESYEPYGMANYLIDGPITVAEAITGTITVDEDAAVKFRVRDYTVTGSGTGYDFEITQDCRSPLTDITKKTLLEEYNYTPIPSPPADPIIVPGIVGTVVGEVAGECDDESDPAITWEVRHRYYNPTDPMEDFHSPFVEFMYELYLYRISGIEYERSLAKLDADVILHIPDSTDTNLYPDPLYRVTLTSPSGGVPTPDYVATVDIPINDLETGWTLQIVFDPVPTDGCEPLEVTWTQF